MPQWSTNMAAVKQTSKTEDRPSTAEGGLVLLDRSLKILAFDRGATAILKDANQPAVQPQALPKEIMDNIRQCKPAALSSLRIYLRIGKHEYLCRAYLLEWLNWLASQPMVAVHLAKVSTSNDAVYEATSKYLLTNREQEVLRGISIGLASKTIADRMDISPNTVKAFLRLIMIKMGVSSRSGIVAAMLQNRMSVDKAGAGPRTHPDPEMNEGRTKKSAMAASAGPPARLINGPDSGD
jgi:DNA-binding CsgD family transcriptional regulator